MINAWILGETVIIQVKFFVDESKECLAIEPHEDKLKIVLRWKILYNR